MGITSGFDADSMQTEGPVECGARCVAGARSVPLPRYKTDSSKFESLTPQQNCKAEVPQTPREFGSRALDHLRASSLRRSREFSSFKLSPQLSLRAHKTKRQEPWKPNRRIGE